MLIPLSLLLALGAQTPALVDGAVLNAPIVAVFVDGADGAAAEGALTVFGLKEGDRLEPNAVRLGIKRVYLTGAWADVRVYASPVAGNRGVAVNLVLVPDRVVGTIEIDSRGVIPEQRLRPAVGINPGDRFREAELERASVAITRAAASLGYPRARVDFMVYPQGDSDHRITFYVEAGAPTRVRSLRIEGDARMNRQRIVALLGARDGAPFSRLRLEDGLARLITQLREARHLDASATVLRASFEAGLEQVDLVLRVDAGPRFRVRFEGSEALAMGELRAVVNEENLGGTDAGSLDRAERKLLDLYARAGFALAQVRAEVRPSTTEPGEREVRFRIEEGPPVFVREVFVEGAKTRSGFDLADEVWRFVRAEAPRAGLFGRVDRYDVEDVLGSQTPREPRKEWVDRDRLTFFPPSEYGGGFTFWPLFLEAPPYLRGVFLRAGEHVADIYRKEGYLDVRIEGPEPIWLEGERGLRIRYRIVEGQQLMVGTVRFDPPPERASVSELLANSNVVPGGPLDLYLVEDQRVRIEASLRDQGYPFARVTERLVRAPKGSTADVVFALEQGPYVTIDRVRVRGNIRTKDFVILDRAQLRPGEEFRATRVERARAALLRMGLFSSVSITLLDDIAGAARRDLVIEVRERPRYSIEAGGGASLEDGPRAFAVLEARNVFGFGLTARSRAQVNYPALLYDLVYSEEDENNPRKRIESLGRGPIETGLLFTEGQLVLTGEMPRVYGVPFDARLHVDAIGLREIRPAFTLMKGSVLGGVDTQPWSWLRLEPQVEAETSDFDCPTGLVVGRSCGASSTGLTRRQDAGQISQLSVRLLSSLDLRDDPFRPHSGIFSSLTTDFALGVGTLREEGTQLAQPVVSNFVKVAGVVSGYVPLAPDATFALSLRGGNIFPVGNSPDQYIPLYKRFYLGGTGSVRGFTEDSILPVDDPEWPASQRDGPEGGPGSLGGNFFVNGRTELRMRMVGELELGLFVDAGQLALDVSNFRLAGFAIGAGFGVRYNTPVGPLAVDLGWKVIDGNRRLPGLTTNERLNLHFAIGYF